MNVKIRLTKESPYEQKQVLLENITEIHFNYPSSQEERRVAFESDTDGTGYTYEVRYVEEFETIY